jgi:hypothetical protein
MPCESYGYPSPDRAGLDEVTKVACELREVICKNVPQSTVQVSPATARWKHRKETCLQSDWVWSVKVGDVLKTPSGDLRVVQDVRDSSGGKSYRKLWFEFTIRRCSWTRRPYTLYNGAEIFYMGWRPTNYRVEIDPEFADKFRASVKARVAAECPLKCCAVKGAY